MYMDIYNLYLVYQFIKINSAFELRQEDRRENIYVEYVNLETIYYIIID